MPGWASVYGLFSENQAKNSSKQRGLTNDGVGFCRHAIVFFHTFLVRAAVCVHTHC